MILLVKVVLMNTKIFTYKVTKYSYTAHNSVKYVLLRFIAQALGTAEDFYVKLFKL